MGTPQEPQRDPRPGWEQRPAWYISTFIGRTARILGSQDQRDNFGFGVAWSRPEPHFKWRHGPAELVMEGYYEHSRGRANAGGNGTVTDALGVIWYGRFRFPKRHFSLYAEIGEGAQISSSESYDLGTRLNSSPMIGAGFLIRQGSQETLIGLRILHLSNAGLNGRNNGQNQVFLYAAVRF